jgi:hypothetical protein
MPLLVVDTMTGSVRPHPLCQAATPCLAVSGRRLPSGHKHGAGREGGQVGARGGGGRVQFVKGGVRVWNLETLAPGGELLSPAADVTCLAALGRELWGRTWRRAAAKADGRQGWTRPMAGMAGKADTAVHAHSISLLQPRIPRTRSRRGFRYGLHLVYTWLALFLGRGGGA